MSPTLSRLDRKLVAHAREFAERELRPVAAHYDETERPAREYALPERSAVALERETIRYRTSEAPGLGHDVIMPKIGMYLEDIRLLEWLQDEGAEVRRGDLLFTYETDKITSDVEAEEPGWLHRIVEVGAMVPIGGVVGRVAETREEYEGWARGVAAQPREPEPAQSELFLDYIRAADTAGTVSPVEPASAAEPRTAREAGAAAGGKVSPRARALIAELGLSPETVAAIPATGPEGRLTDRDVKAFVAGQAEATAPAQVPEGPAVAERIPLRGRRRVIARRMVESLQTTAQLTSILELDAGPVVEWRERSESKVSYTALFLVLAARSLRRHPLLNSRVAGEEIEILAEVNVGFAVNTDDGVIVPVVRAADELGLTEAHDRVAELTERARAGALTLADVELATFTLSNSGTARVDITTAILNPPQVALLWLGRIRERPVAREGNVVVRPTLQACLTYDHRVVDGVPAAEFLATFEDLVTGFPASVGERS
jgi:pyruvate/2-oxoglutarate dehydrogenase complex dihydrolipoamide acyltransferase (E2) component